MKVLFVYSNPMLKSFQQGVAYISAVLRKEGHRTTLLFLSEFNKKKIDRKIGFFQPDLIGISSTTDQMQLSIQVISYLHERYNVPVVLGGIHPTVCPEETIQIEGLLGICRGEGECAMLELANALESKNEYLHIKNFWFKDNGEIIKNELRPLIENLDSLPFPDYEIFDYQEILKAKGFLNILASRGCPFDCSYCMNEPLRNIYKNKGRYVRHRSADNVINEIKNARKKYGNINFIEFYDDTFILNSVWLGDFCQRYAQEVRLPFVCNARVDLINEAVVKQLKSAGCLRINMAIESGNEYIRSKVLKRNIKEEDIIRAFGLFKSNGIKVHTHNMIGVPYETEETIKETIALNKKIRADSLQVSIFYPYPKTKLAQVCKEKGWISNRKVRSYRETSILDQPSISAERVNYYTFIFKSAVFDSKSLFIVKKIIFYFLAKNHKVTDWIRIDGLRWMRILAPSLVKKRLKVWLHYT